MQQTLPVDHLSVIAPSEGTLPPRASSPDTTATRISLDGTWRFRLHASLNAAARHPVPAAPQELGAGWADIAVPGHWVLQGFGLPSYANTTYPFPVDPPRVPSANPTGDHVRDFDWHPSSASADTAGGRWVLRFEGVDSTGLVFLNGITLGTTRGSRLEQDFDVTDHLVPGLNRLVVRVSQWSAQTYVEDQDTWWLPGIFRSVSLLERPDEEIGDLVVFADYDAADGSGSLRIDSEAPARIVSPELLVLAASTGETIRLPNVEPWSAESPKLYRVQVSTDTETRVLRVGFRRVEIAGGRLLVNGAPISFRGVNHHDFHPERGRALTRQDVEDDIRTMKQHNVNALRTSHYPPTPHLLDLCDEHGLWVVDECDLETHGFMELDPSNTYVDPHWTGNPSDDPAWREVYLDRVRRMVERDKNHPSIVLWSLGNEAGTGRNLAAMAEWTHGRDATRPVLYTHDVACDYVDVFSEMYTWLDALEAIGRGVDRIDPSRESDTPADLARRELPFLLSEFGHAMGNGPGGLLDYRALFEAHDRLQGGFVWEWRDQGLARRLPDGRTGYAYGGDHGEPVHDGPFSIDGLVFPDGSPSPALLEFKAVFAPLRIDIDPTGAKVRVHNLRDVASLDDLVLRWTVAYDGVTAGCGRLDLGPVPARSTGCVDLPDLPTGQGERCVTVNATTRTSTWWAEAGHEVAFAQQVQSPPRAGAAEAVPGPFAPVDVLAEGPVRVGPATFDRDSGVLLALGDVQFSTPPRVDLWRAPTNNDLLAGSAVPVAQEWRRNGLDALDHTALEVSADEGHLRVLTRVAPLGRSFGVHAEFSWSVPAQEGAIDLQVRVRPYGPWTATWPRLGLRFALPASFDQVGWYGYGPGERYPDTFSATRLGRWTATVADLQTPYVFPQENGARGGVRAVTFTADTRLEVTAVSEIGFTARPWTSEELTTAQHAEELVAGPETVVTLDAALDGIGSAACGPFPSERDRLRPRAVDLRVRFRAVPDAGPTP